MLSSQSFAVRVALFYGVIFLVIGTYMPFFPAFLAGKGMTASQISLILSLPLIFRLLITPMLSDLADGPLGARRMLIGVSWATFAAVLCFTFVDVFIGFALVTLLFVVPLTAIMPLTEVVAMDGVKRAGLNYGRMRLWGSLTFIAASLVGGMLIGVHSSDVVLPLLIGVTLLVALGAHLLPKPEGQGRLKSIAVRPRLSLAGTRELLSNRLFLLFVVAGSAAQASHAVLYAFGTLNWQGQGISSGVIGGLWSLGVIAEILLFFFSSGPLKRFGALGLILLAGAAGVVRWTWTAFDPGLVVLIPLQVLHGLTYGAAHLGAIYFIGEAVPDRLSATAQGLFAAIHGGLIMALVTLASGPVFEAYQGRAYLMMTLLSAVTIVCVILLRKSWDGSPLVPDEAEPRVHDDDALVPQRDPG